MDTDKVKVFGARIRVGGTAALAELERAEKVSLTISLRIESVHVAHSTRLFSDDTGKNEGQSGQDSSPRNQLLR